ncbi:S8 family serine peptidase [Paraferrimonas sp. SM1919]|uniref:S8 family serine peptidase n=1 Tax=Paraferrimonas sp. SM1919 TaxID=2662263 RepID=UPI0013D541AE|nr:S8 family serine peptidase [Paraferrimonas sp. SM1919]
MKFNLIHIAASSILAAAISSPTLAANGSVDVIIKLNTEHASQSHAANKSQAAQLARSLGIEPTHTYGSALFGFSATIPQARMQSLQNHPLVDHVAIDVVYQLPKTQARPGGGSPQPQSIPWGIARVGADVTSNEGAGMHVYVLDTGVDIDHPDIAANLGNGFAPQTCKGGSCLEAWDDDHGHGTHVAGTIAALDNDIDVVGVASQVTIHPIKICTKAGSCASSGTIAGLDWMVNEVQTRGEPAVANLSIGGSGSVTGTCTDSGFSGTDSYHEAYCNAKNAGVVIVVAAGNSSADAQNYTPAGFEDSVISVSSAREGDDWNGFSNWGNNSASWTSNNSAPVAIAAPGGSVLSLNYGGGTSTKSGTSMASPHGAGAAALYMATNPQALDASAFHNVRAALLNAAESTDSWNNTSGYPHDEDFLDVRGF